MKKLVISLGGSLLSNDFNYSSIVKYANLFEKLHNDGYDLIVTVGGGKLARKYIDVCSGIKNKSQKQKNWNCDLIAISITHSNALLLKLLTDEKIAYSKIPKTEFSIKSAIKKQQKTHKIIYCGGTKPNQSTDSTAVYCAKISATNLIINATNIDGVYNKNPKKFNDAKKINKLSYSEFEKIVLNNSQTPGKYALFDAKPIKILKKNKIKLIVLDGRKSENILNAIQGENIGSLIS